MICGTAVHCCKHFFHNALKKIQFRFCLQISEVPANTFVAHPHTMKKHFIALAATAAFFAPAAQAQDTDADESGVVAEKPKPATCKGNFTIGSTIGLANLSYGKSAGGSQNVYQYDAQLSPSLGYFVTDHLLVSGSLSVGTAGSGLRNENQYRNINAGIGLGARYYFGKAVNSRGEINKLRFYADAGGGYYRSWDRFNAGNGRQDRSSYSDVALNAGAGINYFATRSIAFEAGLRYDRNLEIERAARFKGNVQLQLGVRFFLNRK
jgi:hypothetical protein